MRKIMMSVFILLILSEGILQLLARNFNPHGSYANFFQTAQDLISGADAKSTLFFVGDSTVFGGGASDEEVFSLPAQFQDLLSRSGSSIKVLNLGYPGTTGREHLEVLRLLPQGARVIMRTGINDSWKRHESYKLHIFGHYFELRLLKLLMITWYGWKRDEVSESASVNYFEELKAHSQQRQFELYFVDYFLGEKTFMNTYFNGANNFIPLAQILLQKGFGSRDGRISEKFLSYDLVHANDLGYKLQALAVFNWFAERELLGLKKVDQLELVVDERSLSELRDTLNSWLSKIKASYINAGDIIPMAMKSAWQLYAVTGDEKIKIIYDKLGKLYIFAFHNIYPITYALNREYRMRESDQTYESASKDAEEINFLFQITRVLGHRSNHDYVSEYQEQFRGILDMSPKYSDYSFLESPFPLELCPLFMHEVGPEIDKVSVLETWKEFFGFEFELSALGHKRKIRANIDKCSMKAPEK